MCHDPTINQVHSGLIVKGKKDKKINWDLQIRNQIFQARHRHNDRNRDKQGLEGVSRDP